MEPIVADASAKAQMPATFAARQGPTNCHCDRWSPARLMSVVLETQRLMLRPWTSADLEPLETICSDHRVMQFVGDGRPWSLVQTQSFLDRAVAHWREHGFCQWPLFLKADASLIGFCGFVPSQGGAEIGWRLACQHWGRGLATEAADAVLRHGFETLGLQRVTATVQSGNRSSLRVIEKLGMRHEGTIQRNGREVVLYAITSASGGR